MATQTTRPYRYEQAKRLLALALEDLAVLAVSGQAGPDWKNIAGTAAANLRAVAALLEGARAGNIVGPAVFPLPSECLTEER